jgi:uncharacterized protein (DUF983 family)
MVVKNLLLDKCPNCGKGRVFPNNNLFSFLKLNKMNNSCPVCHEGFHKEPGFYWGAMYVSYALNIVELLITYFVCRILGTGTYDWINLIIMISVIILLSPFNFRISRLIWLYIFS